MATSTLSVEDSEAAETLCPIEAHSRLSESVLWQLQRAFYLQRGTDAWRQTVPEYITSNTFIADAYARVVLGFLRDCHPTEAETTERSGTPSTIERVNIVELGSGSGRFAYYFLNALRRSHRESSRVLPFRYIMTDLAQANIDAWRAHPSFQEALNEGVLDFAQLDAEHDDVLVLQQSNERISQDTIDSPVVVLANYLFDSIPQDAFRVKDGRLEETLVSVTSPRGEPDLDDPAVLGGVNYSFTQVAAALPHYGDQVLDGILDAYRAELSEASFSVPVAALRCCERLRRLSRGRLLLLASDKGYVQLDQFKRSDCPEITVHGSISLAVNFDAIGRYFRCFGGHMLQPAHQHARLLTVGFLLGPHSADHDFTRRTFAEAVGGFTPDDFYSLKAVMNADSGQLNIDQLLDFLRLSRSDPGVLGGFLHRLLELVPEVAADRTGEIRREIRSCWNNYYHQSEERDLPFGLAMLFYQLGDYGEALEYFQASRELYGFDLNTSLNTALCHYALGEFEAARRAAKEVIEAEPTHEPALALLARIGP